MTKNKFGCFGLIDCYLRHRKRWIVNVSVIIAVSD